MRTIGLHCIELAVLRFVGLAGAILNKRQAKKDQRAVMSLSRAQREEKAEMRLQRLERRYSNVPGEDEQRLQIG